ncbi:hypothetical protein UFOVP1437_34 [uncultured Caudovirales phage]|uniref:Uncharacterized protein n=1 Tax=uncultured Caudovirales phage TaxID=2100421 RepID=A0A6J5SFD5_9CAUD|nr:hypothetical protein UFOVP1437_34 [uncultured Caudovirales phage]CAB5228136.1 hypothetical protein UFOVP1531_30 [uncultured Caudovirales phage]
MLQQKEVSKMGFKSTKDKSDFQNFQFTGLIDYARVHEPSFTNSKTGQYSLNIKLENKSQVDKFLELMKSLNVSENVFNPKTKKEQPRLKDNGDGTFSVALKRDAINSKNKEATIEVVDSKGSPIPKHVLIGNGSTATVHGFVYQGEDGGVMRLSGLQVIDLIPFTKSKFKSLSSGFVVNSGPSGVSADTGDDDSNMSVF